jgi:hypothetical protein
VAICIQHDNRIRLISSALLFTPFIDENSQWTSHALKDKTLEYLRPYVSHPCLQLSREIAREHWMSAFMCYAVLLDDDPHSLTPRAQPFGYDMAGCLAAFRCHEYPALLRRFYRDSNIADFWNETAADWEAILGDCRRLVAQGRIEPFLDQFFGDLPVEMRLVPNPLLPASFGFGPNDGSRAYAIIGPPTAHATHGEDISYTQWGNDFTDMAFHEFAHSYIGQAVALTNIVAETIDWDGRMDYKGWFPEKYVGWECRFQEIAVRAVTALYREYVSGPNEAQAIIQREVREFGITLIEPLHRCFANYFAARHDGDCVGILEFLSKLPGLLQSQ